MCDNDYNGSPFGDSPITRRKGNKMHYKSFKEAYLYGFKDGMVVGMDKGIQLGEEWSECSEGEYSDCPPANTMPMLEGSTSSE